MRTSFLLILLFFVATLAAGRPQPFADKDFVLIKPGEFQMGCTIGDSACDDYEKPAHPVRITRAFQVQSHQVTEGQLKEVTGRDLMWGKTFTAKVSWDEAQKFLKKLNGKKDGYQYRLLTEAEWEFVARNETRDVALSTPTEFAPYGKGTGHAGGGGGGDNFISAIDLMRKVMQMKCDESQKPLPCPQPGEPNARGLYDMLGNRPEWVQDWHAPYPEGLQIDPKGPPDGALKVVRGYNEGSTLASFTGTASPPSRVSYRSVQDTKTGGILGLGFRSVREPRTN